jgi:hypothetical protein
MKSAIFLDSVNHELPGGTAETFLALRSASQGGSERSPDSWGKSNRRRSTPEKWRESRLADIPPALAIIRYVRRWHADNRREVSLAFSEYQSCRRTGR